MANNLERPVALIVIRKGAHLVGREFDRDFVTRLRSRKTADAFCKIGLVIGRWFDLRDAF